jgi:hypothetical protein
MDWDHDGMRVMNDLETRLSATGGYHGFKLYVSPDWRVEPSTFCTSLVALWAQVVLFCHGTRAPEGKRLKTYSIRWI